MRFNVKNNIKLKQKLKCSDEFYYHCFEQKIAQETSKSCPVNCSAISTFSDAIPLCTTVEDFKCSLKIVEQIQEDSSSKRCLPKCNTINYYSPDGMYKENQDSKDSKRNIWIRYRLNEKVS